MNVMHSSKTQRRTPPSTRYWTRGRCPPGDNPIHLKRGYRPPKTRAEASKAQRHLARYSTSHVHTFHSRQRRTMRRHRILRSCRCCIASVHTACSTVHRAKNPRYYNVGTGLHTGPLSPVRLTLFQPPFALALDGIERSNQLSRIHQNAGPHPVTSPLHRRFAIHRTNCQSCLGPVKPHVHRSDRSVARSR